VAQFTLENGREALNSDGGFAHGPKLARGRLKKGEDRDTGFWRASREETGFQRERANAGLQTARQISSEARKGLGRACLPRDEGFNVSTWGKRGTRNRCRNDDWKRNRRISIV